MTKTFKEDQGRESIERNGDGKGFENRDSQAHFRDRSFASPNSPFKKRLVGSQFPQEQPKDTGE